MTTIQALVLLTSAVLVSSQRPFFAGSRPIGFPELLNKTTTPSVLEDKFGEVTTQRLPIEAQGDRELVDRLSKLPLDKQPFWLINWQALEANREKPQTYPQKPNPFVEGNFQNTNNGAPQIQNTNVNPISGFSNVNSGVTSPGNTGNSNSGSGTQPQNWKAQGQLNTNNGTSNVDNRYGNEASTSSNSNNPVSNDNNKPKPVISNNDDVKKPTLAHPALISPNPDNKNTQGARVTQEENEFEDIEVRKVKHQ